MLPRQSCSAAALTLLLAACGQSSPAPSAAPAPRPEARAVDAAPLTSPTRPGNFNVLASSKAVTGSAKVSAAVPRGTPLAPVHMNDRLGEDWPRVACREHAPDRAA